jgi:tetratricopeptide (TPR) repeat protein
MTPRRAGGWLFALLLIAVGWRAASLGLADHFARRDPGRALTQRADHPMALQFRAEQLFESGQWAEAESMARRSLEANPLQARPYRLLGQVAQAKGDATRAYALYRIAARRSPRDVTTRTWLFNHHLANDQADAAMGDLDALLSAQPRLLPALSSTISGVATRPELQPAFVTALQKSPPWRADVMSFVVGQTQDMDGIARLMQRLRAIPGGLDASVASAWVERLIGERRYGPAYLNWVADLDPDARLRLGNVYNGDFELPLSNTGFDWHMDPIPGARMDVLVAPGGQGKALRLVFDDQRVAFRHLGQLLVLPAGKYRLEGRVQIDELRTGPGLSWSLSCAEDQRPLAKTESFRGTGPWRSFSTDFEIPAQACDGQWLRLQLPTAIASERRISGAIWFDGLRIERQQ